MQRFAPFNFVIDLAVSCGSVRIFEIGYLDKSGLEGFKKLHGSCVREAAETFAQNVSPYRLGEPAKHNGNLRLATLNKNIFYTLFADTCPEVMPQTCIYPAMDAQHLYKAAFSDFKGIKGVAFKNPEINRGEGVYLATLDPREEEKETAALKANPAFSLPHLSTPTLAVQAAAIPDTVVVNGKGYAPTMRVAATAYQDMNGNLQIKYHGAYFKLPHASLDDTRTSFQARFVRSGANPDRAVNEAKVTDAAFENVTAQLDAFFVPRLAEVFFADSLDLALSMLTDPRHGVRLTGLEFTTSLYPHAAINPTKLAGLINTATTLADTDIIARKYMMLRATEDAETWSPVMRKLRDYAQSLTTNPSKPVIRIKAPVPQTGIMR